ncbi:MAG: hypothetical protein JHC31_13210 [Sulfurihydrogenibium sp.]|jgi:hypothetical protein|nr:hypothetical protein [Sulfurihydrogenibium sp.]MBX0312704.1 hypothetical protein [Sulfurihydrogenibium sp.]
MKDLFGKEIMKKPEIIKVNIYADEVQEIEDPVTLEKWIYIGLIVENLDKPLLDEIIAIRYMNNFDVTSPYFKKNDRIIHWHEIDDAEVKNIAKRWIEYILDPSKSGDKFYAYVLGINTSKLNLKKFGGKYSFNILYNRFFRSAVLYILKSAFPNNTIIVKNIFHEKGQQVHHKFFPWHSIYKIEEREENIEFECREITFLPKSHRENEGGDKRSNLIQLCDLFLGLCVGLLHGIGTGKKEIYRKELLDLFLPLFERMINEPHNPHSRYQHKGRIMIRFFPREKTKPDDIMRKFNNQFYTERKIYYIEQKSGQLKLFGPP